MNKNKKPLFVYHRINNVEDLNKVDSKSGIEADIRYYDNNFILSHDHNQKGQLLENYLKSFDHKLFVANIKVAGIEDSVIEILRSNKVKNFFLLDIEQPYLIKNYKEQGENLSVRYSFLESIENAKMFAGKVSWIWIDTYQKINLDIDIIKQYNSCLVSPSRWGKYEDIDYYNEYLKKINFIPDCILIKEGEEKLWTI